MNNSLGFSSCGQAVLSGRGLGKGWVKLEPAWAKELLVHVGKTPNKNGKKHKPELVPPHAKQQVYRKFPSNQRIIENKEEETCMTLSYPLKFFYGIGMNQQRQRGWKKR